jgi:hypothetical protein
MRKSNYVYIDDVSVVGETEKAILCQIEDRKVWIPKSQIHEDSEVYEGGDTGTLVITEWIAKQKELDDYHEYH